MLRSLLAFMLLTSFGAFAQKKPTLSGYITDVRNGEALSYAKVFVQELKTGAVVNSYGFYSLTIPSGNYTIEFRADGFQTQVLSIALSENQTRNVELDMAVQETKDIRKIIKGNLPDSKKMNLVVDFIKKHNGIEYATKKMNEFRTQAFEILNSLHANPIHKKQLNLLVNFVIDRNV